MARFLSIFMQTLGYYQTFDYRYQNHKSRLRHKKGILCVLILITRTASVLSTPGIKKDSWLACIVQKMAAGDRSKKSASQNLLKYCALIRKKSF